MTKALYDESAETVRTKHGTFPTVYQDGVSGMLPLKIIWSMATGLSYSGTKQVFIKKDTNKRLCHLDDFIIAELSLKKIRQEARDKAEKLGIPVHIDELNGKEQYFDAEQMIPIMRLLCENFEESRRKKYLDKIAQDEVVEKAEATAEV